MIGKAIHRILKDKISDLSSGGVFPVIMPQNVNYTLSSSSSYPAVIYHNFTEYETSKDELPNIVYTRVMLQIVSNNYSDVNSIGTKIRDVLDHYKDLSLEGLVNVPGYNYLGNQHNFIENIDISHIFYQEEEDEYFDKLQLFTRRIEYDVYYYDDVMKFSYDVKNKDGYTPTNPLALCYDFTQNNLMRGSHQGEIKYTSIPSTQGQKVDFVFNKLGRVKDLYTSSLVTGNETMYEYIKAPSPGGQPNIVPSYNTGVADGTKPSVDFSEFDSLGIHSFSSTFPTMFMCPYGAMFIFIYKPTTTGGENYLLGSSNETSEFRPFLVSHAKIGDDIHIKIKTKGIEFDGQSNERTLISSTDSDKYWGGDYHFLSVSLGGSKNYTGGSYNQKGWFEYFNSEYNPKLTTGQIIKNNQIAGNTDSLQVDLYTNFCLSRIGNAQVDSSAGFKMYELLVFIPNEAQTHSIDEDSAPFQPTDIIYKKVKEYIYNKYKSLK